MSANVSRASSDELPVSARSHAPKKRAGAPFGSSSFRGMRCVHLSSFEGALPLSADKYKAYCRRYTTLFVDESRRRHGGLGSVAFARTALGEPVAVKTMLVPSREDSESESAYEKRVDSLRAVFRCEYENHLALNGVRGFPRLYGYGLLDGVPTIVMEWVEGVTLEQACRRLAVDDQGRLSPLVVARLGRDLFDVLMRLENIGEGMVHRDLSPANVMIRTNHLSVEQQAVEGAFDLCLIDFGSSAPVRPSSDDSFTEARGAARAATANYAPPEMLSTDVPHLDALRKSPKIDVYAAGSILYWLLSGRVPFDLSDAGETSPYRMKVDNVPHRPDSAHASGCDLGFVLKAEPEVSSLLGTALLDVSPSPSEEAVRQALALVDDQLADVVMSCLKARQDDRPTAVALRSALSTFCSCYAQNVDRALRGEQLLPCTADAAWYAGTSPKALRRMIRSVGTAVASGIWFVVVASVGILLQGASATAYVPGGGSWTFEIWAPVVWMAFAIPLVCALLARRGGKNPRSTFWRGTVMLVTLYAVLAFTVGGLSFDVPARVTGLLAAIFAAAAAGWCPLVLEYATTVGPALVQEARRLLPAGGSTPERAALQEETPPTKKMKYINQTAYDEPTYEVSEDASNK